LSVGHSAVGSVAEMISAFAPLLTAAWMAGIWDAGVSAVPLVSVPVSPSVSSAAIAPPEFALSAVVKYEFPRFFGMTKTFRPVFSPEEDAEDDEEEDEDAAALGDDELDDEHAASRTGTMTSGTASPAVCLNLIS
jgi:hypothetical protein